MECNKEEAIRARDIAAKKLLEKDFGSAKLFALKAQALFPGLTNISKLLSVCEVHCAAGIEINGVKDWYRILQVEPTADESSLRKQYRKLAISLHPDGNKFAGAEAAFKIIGEAVQTLFDKEKRSIYDIWRGKNFKHVLQTPQSKWVNPNSHKAAQPEVPPNHKYDPWIKEKQNILSKCPHCNLMHRLTHAYLNKAFSCKHCCKIFVVRDVFTSSPFITVPEDVTRYPNPQFNSAPTNRREVKPTGFKFANVTRTETATESSKNQKVTGKRKIEECCEDEFTNIENNDSDTVTEEAKTYALNQNRRQATRCKQNARYDEVLIDDNDDLISPPTKYKVDKPCLVSTKSDGLSDAKEISNSGKTNKKLNAEMKSDEPPDENSSGQPKECTEEERNVSPSSRGNISAQEAHPESVVKMPQSQPPVDQNCYETVPPRDPNSLNNCAQSFRSRCPHCNMMHLLSCVHVNRDFCCKLCRKTFLAFDDTVAGCVPKHPGPGSTPRNCPPPQNGYTAAYFTSKGFSAQDASKTNQEKPFGTDPSTTATFTHGFFSVVQENQNVAKFSATGLVGKIRGEAENSKERGGNSLSNITQEEHVNIVSTINPQGKSTGVKYANVKTGELAEIFSENQNLENREHEFSDRESNDCDAIIQEAKTCIPIVDSISNQKPRRSTRLNIKYVGDLTGAKPKRSKVGRPCHDCSKNYGIYDAQAINNCGQTNDELNKEMYGDEPTKKSSSGQEEKSIKKEPEIPCSIGNTDPGHLNLEFVAETRQSQPVNRNIHGTVPPGVRNFSQNCDNGAQTIWSRCPHCNFVQRAHLNRDFPCKHCCKTFQTYNMFIRTRPGTVPGYVPGHPDQGVPEHNRSQLQNTSKADTWFSAQDASKTTQEKASGTNSFSTGASPQDTSRENQESQSLAKFSGNGLKGNMNEGTAGCKEKCKDSVENINHEQQNTNCLTFLLEDKFERDTFANLHGREPTGKSSKYQKVRTKIKTAGGSEDGFRGAESSAAIIQEAKTCAPNVDGVSNKDQRGSTSRKRDVNFFKDFGNNDDILSASKQSLGNDHVRDSSYAFLQEAKTWSPNVDKLCNENQRQSIRQNRNVANIDDPSIDNYIFSASKNCTGYTPCRDSSDAIIREAKTCAPNVVSVSNENRRQRSTRQKQNVSDVKDLTNDDDIRDTPCYDSTKDDGLSDANEISSIGKSKTSKDLTTEMNIDESPKERTNGQQERVAEPKVGLSSRGNISPIKADPGPVTYPDPEFNDFDNDRDASKFIRGQIWATYDDFDGMPRFYAKIIEVICSFKVRLTWLEPILGTQAETGRLDANLPLHACGNFRSGATETTDNRAMFSHLMLWHKGRKRYIYTVRPRKGQVWAMYKNWDIKWSYASEGHKPLEYDIVEILYADVSAIDVTILQKIEGFVSVFSRDLDAEFVNVPSDEIRRFSHMIPCHKIPVPEVESYCRNCYELDPAALPSDVEHKFYSVKLSAQLEHTLRQIKEKCSVPAAARHVEDYVAASDIVALENERLNNFRSENSYEKCLTPASAGHLENPTLQPTCEKTTTEIEWFHNFESEKSLGQCLKPAEVRGVENPASQCASEKTSLGSESFHNIEPEKSSEECLESAAARCMENPALQCPPEKTSFESESVHNFEPEKSSEECLKSVAAERLEDPASQYTNEKATLESERFHNFEPDKSFEKCLSPTTAGHEGNPASQCTSEKIAAPESEWLHDFESDKSLEKLEVGQIWALQCDIDGFPRYYAYVTAVDNSGPKVTVRWIDYGGDLVAVGPWLENGLPITCGKFKFSSSKGSRETFCTLDKFCHLVQFQSNKRYKYNIYPQVGEVWAVYRKWSIEWEDGDIKTCGYNIVEVLSAGSVTKTAVLMKVGGSENAIFTRKTEKGSVVAIDIPRDQNLRFSHRVPSHCLTSGPWEGCWQLDRLCVPCTLL